MDILSDKAILLFFLVCQLPSQKSTVFKGKKKFSSRSQSIVPWVPLNSAYPHLHEKKNIFNQFLSNSVDILFITYKSYSANFRKVSFIVNELFR